MLLLVVGLIFFLGIHSVRIVAPAWRDERIAAVGENRWKGIYSIVSLISFALIIYGYYLARQNSSDLYEPFTGLYHLVLMLMLASMILLGAFNVGASFIKRAVRHPFLMAIILWSASHLMMNGDAASVLLFGAFLVWAVVDLVSALSRPETAAPAPVVRNDIIAVISGLVIYLLLLWKLHEWLFGVVPVI